MLASEKKNKKKTEMSNSVDSDEMFLTFCRAVRVKYDICKVQFVMGPFLLNVSLQLFNYTVCICPVLFLITMFELVFCSMQLYAFCNIAPNRDM